MILNLTQHEATPQQIAEGVVDLTPEDRAQLRVLLTFDELPSAVQITTVASAICALALMAGLAGPPVAAAMIGGAPFLMSALERALRAAGVTPVYAFSRRESVEEVQPDGTVRKINVFRHLGFVKPPL